MKEQRQCYCCGSTKTGICYTRQTKKPYEDWRYNGDTGLFLCTSCYEKLSHGRLLGVKPEKWCYCCGAKTSRMWFTNPPTSFYLCQRCYYRIRRGILLGGYLTRPKKCFACGLVKGRRFILNYDPENNALCQACWQWLKRLPKTTRRPKRTKEECYACGSHTTACKKISGKPQWYRNYDRDDNVLCKTCYNSLFRDKEVQREHDRRAINYKSKSIYLPKNPRIGVCNWCRAVKGEINAQTGKLCRRTDMHHEKYDDANPSANTIEICINCHGVITHKGKRKTIRNRPDHAAVITQIKAKYGDDYFRRMGKLGTPMREFKKHIQNRSPELTRVL